MKLSVIMPTYNYGHLLPSALQSLAAQNIQNFELLVVDDGSTDNTEDIVRRFSGQFRNCLYLRKPHTGIADSRRFAVEAASGSWIAFIDSDDLWSPDYLAIVRNFAARFPRAELIISDGLHVRDSGVVMGPVLVRTTPPTSGPVRSIPELFSLCTNFCPTGIVFTKSLYLRAGPFNAGYGFGPGEDTDWIIRAVIAGAHCIRIDQKLFLHRWHGSNMTTDPIPYLQPWLGLYRTTIKGSALGPEFERCARYFTRDYVLRLLGICSPSKGRALLSQTLRALPADPILTCAYLSTYFGSISCLKLLKRGKRLLRKRFRKSASLDLRATPETVFAALKRREEGALNRSHETHGHRLHV